MEKKENIKKQEERKKCQNCQSLEKQMAEMKKINLAKEVNLINQYNNELENRLKFKDQDLITALLPILDSLETALQFDNLNSQTKMFLKGVEISLEKLQKILANFNLKKIATKVGMIYNPEKEETIDAAWNPQKPENSILKIKQTGYQLNERVIRATQVIINQKSVNKKAKK